MLFLFFFPFSFRSFSFSLFFYIFLPTSLLLLLPLLLLLLPLALESVAEHFEVMHRILEVYESKKGPPPSPASVAASTAPAGVLTPNPEAASNSSPHGAALSPALLPSEQLSQSAPSLQPPHPLDQLPSQPPPLPRDIPPPLPPSESPKSSSGSSERRLSSDRGYRSTSPSRHGTSGKVESSRSLSHSRHSPYSKPRDSSEHHHRSGSQRSDEGRMRDREREKEKDRDRDRERERERERDSRIERGRAESKEDGEL